MSSGGLPVGFTSPQSFRNGGSGGGTFQATGRGARGARPVSAWPPGFSHRRRTSGPPSSGRLKTSTMVNRAHPRPGEGSPCCLAARCVLAASAAVRTLSVLGVAPGGGSGSGSVLSATLSTAA